MDVAGGEVAPGQGGRKSDIKPGAGDAGAARYVERRRLGVGDSALVWIDRQRFRAVAGGEHRLMAEAPVAGVVERPLWNPVLIGMHLNRSWRSSRGGGFDEEGGRCDGGVSLKIKTNGAVLTSGNGDRLFSAARREGRDVPALRLRKHDGPRRCDEEENEQQTEELTSNHGRASHRCVALPLMSVLP